MPIGVYKRKTKDPVERFMSFVEPEPNTGCWLWKGHCTNGYGSFYTGGSRINKKMVTASRFSYETFVGQIPEGFSVLHKCDFPPCVNPDHFFLGVGVDNMGDMFLKGRGVKSKKGLPYGASITPSGKFHSQVGFKRKIIHLGDFDTAEEASKVAIQKKLELLQVQR